MRTLEAPNGTVFRYHDGLERVVEVTRPSAREVVYLNGQDLLWFVAQYVADRKIAALEQAEPEEILGIARKKR